MNWDILLIMVLSTLGPSLVIALVGYGGMIALARNPTAAPRIQITMLLTFVFAESIAIVALLVTFHLFVGRTS